MVTPDTHYAFLKKHYRHNRFEGRNDSAWGADYSMRIANYRYDDLRDSGFSLISAHESASGEAVIYDADLNLLDSVPTRKTDAGV